MKKTAEIISDSCGGCSSPLFRCSVMTPPEEVLPYYFDIRLRIRAYVDA